MKTEYTDNPICPHCGNEIKDILDYDFKNRECINIDCVKCCNQFDVCKNTDISYNTYKCNKYK